MRPLAFLIILQLPFLGVTAWEGSAAKRQSSASVSPSPSHSIRYDPLELEEEKIQRTVWKEGDHAVLELRFPPVEDDALHFKVTALSMEYYDTLTPLPALVPRKKGAVKVARFVFPLPAADQVPSGTIPPEMLGGRLDIECSFVNDGESQSTVGTDEQEGGEITLTPGSPVHVSHRLTSRTLELAMVSASCGGKPLSGFSKSVVTIQPGKPVPLPGLAGGSSTHVEYRYRYLPNTRWQTTEQDLR